MNVAFIGLGHMGQPMVKNLLQKNIAVTVYDVSADAMSMMNHHGAKLAKCVSDAIANADIIITMVQTSEQVSEICHGDAGIFKRANANALYIDCSSIDIATTKSLHLEAAKHQLAMLDAPVSGGVKGAENATLTFMVGGQLTDFQRAESLLQKMGKKIIHAGAAGSGQAAKICNNLLLGISMIGVSEAFTLAEKLGLAPQKFFEISSNASGQCWSMTSYCPVPNIIENVPANHDYEPGFMAKMMLKDLRLGINAAESVHTEIPLGTQATDLYNKFVEEGNGEKDFSAIINFIKRLK